MDAIKIEKSEEALVVKKLRSPGEHPYAEIVRQWVRTGGIEPKDIEREAEKEIMWHVSTDDFSIYLSLYRDERGEIFFWIEAAVAFLNRA